MKKIELNIRVTSLLDIEGNIVTIFNETTGKGKLKKEYSNLIFEIDYPLSTPVFVFIPIAKHIADILIPIAKAYKKIYSDPKKYGVWGHLIEDLYFEGIGIKENGVCKLYIGS